MSFLSSDLQSCLICIACRIPRSQAFSTESFITRQDPTGNTHTHTHTWVWCHSYIVTSFNLLSFWKIIFSSVETVKQTGITITIKDRQLTTRSFTTSPTIKNVNTPKCNWHTLHTTRICLFKPIKGGTLNLLPHGMTHIYSKQW